MEAAAYEVDEQSCMLYAICPQCKTLYTNCGGLAVICVHAVKPGKMRRFTCKTVFARRVVNNGHLMARFKTRPKRKLNRKGVYAST